MRLAIHAVGRAHEVRALAALGAQVHEVDSPEAAREAVRALAAGGSFLVLSEEFAEAAAEAPGVTVLVLPGPRRRGLETTRDIVLRSFGVDLVARAERPGRP